MNEAVTAIPRNNPAEARAVSVTERGDAHLGTSCAPELWRTCRTNRRHASHPRRGEAVDFRAAISPCTELLHAAARPRGAATCHLHWLAHAWDRRRSHCRRLVHTSRHHLHYGVELRLRALGPGAVVTALLFGLKAAVLAIVVEAVIRIGKRALKSRALIALAAAAFVGIFFFAVPFPVIILAAGLLGLTGLVRASPIFAWGIDHNFGLR